MDKFLVQDNWVDVPGYREKQIFWLKRDSLFDRIVYYATVDGVIWNVRLNDFPDEPLYTLLVDGIEIIHFNDWPSKWTK